MHTAQRIIKYFAIAFAFIIMASIISGVMFMASTIGWISGAFVSEEIGQMRDESELVGSGEVVLDAEKITAIEIDVAVADLRVVMGDEMKVATNNKYIESWVDGDRLHVVEKDHNLFNWDGNHDLTVYLPREKKFNRVELNSGAGKVEIEELAAQQVVLDVGAGRLRVNKLISTDKTEINSGAGELEILGGQLANLDLDMGAGRTAVTGSLQGNSKISAGVGRLEVNLLGNKEDYAIEISKGIGAVRINGANIEDGERYGDGKNSLEIDGGMGAIEVRVGE